MDDLVEQSARRGFTPQELARARRKRRHAFASLAERRLDRALALADSAMTGFPPPEEAERVIDRLSGDAIVAAWRRAVHRRSLVAILPG
jgi:hypothetical protein